MFSAGDFDVPAFIHGENPPGTAVMKSHPGQTTYHYEEIERGARVRITTTEPEALQAQYTPSCDIKSAITRRKIRRKSAKQEKSSVGGADQENEVAGAVGLEPTPSSLTVRCPTNWTTPQPCFNCKREHEKSCDAFLYRLYFSCRAIHRALQWSAAPRQRSIVPNLDLQSIAQRVRCP